MDKDLRKIIKALKKQGFEVEITKRGHVRVFKDGHKVATFSGTPGDWRSLKNSLSDVKRLGFRWPP